MRKFAMWAMAGAALSLSVPASAATVTMSRAADDIGAGQRVVCLIDAAPAAVLTQGQSVTQQVSEGAHELRCQAVSGGYTPTPTVLVQAQEGKPVQAEVSLGMTRLELKVR